MHHQPNDTSEFDKHESAVRLYSRRFPTVFRHGRGAWLRDEAGMPFLDFFCGAGALNYGHNPEPARSRLIDYIAGDNILHGLDTSTTAKREFLASLRQFVLEPRGLSYKVQFVGPTGTDAVEAALKLARRVTGRRNIVAFFGAFHGMSSGSLAVTGSLAARRAGSVDLRDTAFVPYESGPGGYFDSITYLRQMFADPASGTELPAAVVVESAQVDGGINIASTRWLRDLRQLTAEWGIVLIVDDIQAGCGRTGDFFSFAEAGIQPDLVTLSKSIGGSGLPLSIVLIADSLDQWEPGEHTGTFRGNQLAMVAGAAMLAKWADPAFVEAVADNGRILQDFGVELAGTDPNIECRGRGMLLGLDFAAVGGPSRADEIQRRCFDHGLLVEVCGRRDVVLKVMPPLTISPIDLAHGLDVIRQQVNDSRPDRSA